MIRRYLGYAGLCVLGMAFCSSPALAEGTSWTLGQNVATTRAPSRMLLVDKRLQQLQVVDTYECTTGQRDGGKELSGDMRTPEGVYFVTGKVPGKLSMSEYGGVGYALNYPNPIDRLHGRTGHGIWLHSRGRAITPKETRGCVVVNLDDMDRLKQDLKPGTPVILADGITHAPEDSGVVADVARLLERTDAWNRAWADRSETFFDFYDILSYEKANNVDFGVFRNDKQRTFLHEWLHVVHGKVNILQGPDYWVTWFTQFYKSPVKTVEGTRRLYWIERNGEFYIAGMEWMVEPAFDITFAQRRVPKAASPGASVPTQVAGAVPAPRTSPRDAAKAASPGASVPMQVAEAVPAPRTSPQDAAKAASPGASVPMQVAEAVPAPKSLQPEAGVGKPDVRESGRAAPMVTAATMPTFAPIRRDKAVVPGPVGRVDVPGAEGKATSEVRMPVVSFPDVPVAEQTPPGERMQRGDSDPPRPMPATDGRSGSKQLTTAVMNFVEYWRKCWEGGYLDAYANCYASEAVQQNYVGRKAIRNHKRIVWKNKAPASVRLTNIRVFPQLDGSVVVTMDQQYVDTKRYRDTGVKRIELRQLEGQWIILKEMWKKQ